MNLHGKSIIQGRPTSGGSATFNAFDPARSETLAPVFYEAAEDDVERAFAAAELAVDQLRRKTPEELAKFLETIGAKIVGLGDELITRANLETALPVPRLLSERGRTAAQLEMFAALVREGSWIEAIIDHADPQRKPPKPDVRRMLIPIGPVVVFGASNFPFAFSTAGGDTASALAAGNPVIVKGHPAHPGTSEMVAGAILDAARECDMPAGVFALLQGTSHELSLNVVRHPKASAVGFTGSLRGGRAIFDAAAQRANPIPVFAEMGSTNPVFVLPGALRERADDFATGLQQSVTLGVGQFCTCPGLVIGVEDPAMSQFINRLQELTEAATPATMLHPGILQSYEAGLTRLQSLSSVKGVSSTVTADPEKTQAAPAMLITNADALLEHEEIGEEVFGPSTVVVKCASREQMLEVARSLDGHLTATIHGLPEELDDYRDLIEVLERKVGRLVFNGFPTGVEVCAAMQHGGPYPATTDSRSTSVGAMAIKRFARPVCFQNFPEEALPPQLRDVNESRIWRLVDNEMTRDR